MLEAAGTHWDFLPFRSGLDTYDAIVLAVAHRQYRELGAAAILAWLKEGGVVYDVKHLLPPETVEDRL